MYTKLFQKPHTRLYAFIFDDFRGNLEYFDTSYPNPYIQPYLIYCQRRISYIIRRCMYNNKKEQIIYWFFYLYYIL